MSALAEILQRQADFAESLRGNQQQPPIHKELVDICEGLIEEAVELKRTSQWRAWRRLVDPVAHNAPSRIKDITVAEKEWADCMCFLARAANLLEIDEARANFLHARIVEDNYDRYIETK